MVGAGRLSSDLSAAAGISTAVSAAAKCGADTADRATGKAWLWSGLSKPAGKAGASRQAVALHSR
jgi:hypothetical protein